MVNEIKALILAAGKGTRMKSSKSKVLHEIFSKPILGWVIDSVFGISFKTEPIAIIGHDSSCVQEYLDKTYGNIKTVVQKEQLGTGHAVAQASPLLKEYEGLVLVLCGDTPLITSTTLNDLIKKHLETMSDVTVMTTYFDNPFGYGRIVRDKENNVSAIIEQKDADDEIRKINEVNAGIYCLNWKNVKSAFSELKNNNAQGEYYLTDIIKWANEKNLKVSGYICEDNSEIFGINSRKQLSQAFSLMNQRYLNELMDCGVTIVDPASSYISPDTKIDFDTTIFPNTYIEGKNTISKNCKIGPMTHIRGNCTIGENCKIGNFVELKNAHIANNTNVCHLSYVGDAKIGEHVNIGAGTIFANYNSITKEKKMSKLGNNVSIGSNSVLVAPVEIKDEAFVAALSCITKNVDEYSLAMSRSPQQQIKNWVKSKKGEN